MTILSQRSLDSLAVHEAVAACNAVRGRRALDTRAATSERGRWIEENIEGEHASVAVHLQRVLPFRRGVVLDKKQITNAQLPLLLLLLLLPC